MDTFELIKLAQNGDREACDTLVKENMGLIWSVVRKFSNRGYELDDLFQIGAMGLVKCINKFDLSYDVKFSTYAVPMIIGEIKRFMRDDGIIKISRSLKELAIKGKYVQEQILKERGETPTLSEIALQLEVDVEDLALALESNREVESLYATVYQGDGSPVFLIDKIEQGSNNEEKIVDSISLNEVIEKLPPKERQIIELRYFKDKTQSQVAQEVGVSQVQVSRIEKKVLESMRKIMTV